MRSYAHVLLRWWRFLQAIGVGWDRATPAECRDFVLWLQQARKPISDRRTRSAAQVGTLNPVTRKQHLTDQYAPRTVRHSNAVLRAFYEFWIEEGAGPETEGGEEPPLPPPEDDEGAPRRQRKATRKAKPEREEEDEE